jgi:hypothetical protein
MFSDLPKEPHAEEIAPSDSQQLLLLPFAIQLQNIFPIEIVARRFPVDSAIDLASMVMSNTSTQLNLGSLGIDLETSQAQIQLEVKVNFPLEN